MPGDGILSGPLDIDGPRRRRPTYPTVEGRPGLQVLHRATGVEGPIVGFEHGGVAIQDRNTGNRRLVRLDPGGFRVGNKAVTLVPPKPSRQPRPAGRTASGSTAVRDRKARVARASRILVEGVHDAELVEKVWGDDLRVEGVVVERLDGMDHLDRVVAEFRPGPGRRLGVLLDHLVDGTKEARVAAAVRHPHVLVTGTPTSTCGRRGPPKGPATTPGPAGRYLASLTASTPLERRQTVWSAARPGRRDGRHPTSGGGCGDAERPLQQ